MSTDEEGKDVKLPIYHMGGPNTTPIEVVVQFNGKYLKMEVDTGAAISLISKCTCTYERLFPNLEIVKPSVWLKTYTREAMKLIGEITAEVKYGEQRHTLSLIIVDGNGPSLLGRDWLQSFTLDWKHSINENRQHSQGTR